MNVYINNQPFDLTSAANIPDALSGMDINSQKGIAVAVNNNVIPRTQWESYKLKEHDKITVIKATQGG